MKKLKVANIFIKPNNIEDLCSVSCEGCFKGKQGYVLENIDYKVLDKILFFIDNNIDYETISLSKFGDFFINTKKIIDFIDKYEVLDDNKIVVAGNFKFFKKNTDTFFLRKFKISITINYIDYNSIKSDLLYLYKYIKYNDIKNNITIQISGIITENKVFELFKKFNYLFKSIKVKLLFDVSSLNRGEILTNNYDFFVDNIQQKECLFYKYHETVKNQYDISVLDIDEDKISFHFPNCEKIVLNNFGDINTTLEDLKEKYDLFLKEIKSFLKKYDSRENDICYSCNNYFKNKY